MIRDLAPSTLLLATLPSADGEQEVSVARIDRGVSVILRDVVSGAVFPSIKLFTGASAEADALAYATSLAASL